MVEGLRRVIERQAFGVQFCFEVMPHLAGLDANGVIDPVERDCLVHFTEVERNTALRRERCAGDGGAGTPGGDRYVMCRGPGK